MEPKGKKLLTSSNLPAPAVEAPTGGSYYGYEHIEREQTGGLIEYWRILRRRKGTLILIAFLGTLAAVLSTLPQTSVYQARASLEIQDMNENFLNMRQASPVSEMGSTSALTDIQTQIKILQSETLTKRVLAKLRISKPEDLKAETGRITAWRRALNLPEPAPEQAEDKALEMAADNLKVRAAGQTRIIEILCDSTDAKLAAAFANTLATEFIEANMEARWKMTQHTGEWLQKQLEEMRIKLERSEDLLQRYARRAGLMFTAEKNSVNEEKLRQLQAELGRAMADRVSKQSRYELARTSRPEALPDVLNDTGLRGYQTNLTDLRRQLAELATVYTPEHAKIRRLEAQITTVEAALKRERAAILERIRNEYEEAKGRETLLVADYAKQTQVVTQEAETGIQYNILKREVDSNRQLYEAMLQKVKEASIAAALKASNMRVVDAAEPPRFPYKPSLPMNAALGLLAGLFLGVAFVVMRERADRSLQEPGDASYFLDAPELGVIPSGSEEYRKRFHYGKHKSLPAPVDPSANGKPVVERVELVTWQRKPSAISESFRAVLTSILFSGRNGDRPRVLVLTSASPGEGKTTVVSNLGIALAETHRRVLLIDGDMRKPRLHELFELNNERGLSSLLQERTLGEHSMDGLLQETRVPDLFVLTAGPSNSAATNLLYSATLGELLKRFRDDFDTVLIDTPPMLHMPDARVIGRLADSVILVTRAGRTTRDSAQAACQRFADDDTPVLGVVLNDWNPKASRGGYYGYHGYYKGYYSKGYGHSEERGG